MVWFHVYVEMQKHKLILLQRATWTSFSLLFLYYFPKLSFRNVPIAKLLSYGALFLTVLLLRRKKRNTYILYSLRFESRNMVRTQGGRTQFLQYHFIIIVVSTTQSRSGKDRGTNSFIWIWRKVTTWNWVDPDWKNK